MLYTFLQSAITTSQSLLTRGWQGCLFVFGLEIPRRCGDSHKNPIKQWYSLPIFYELMTLTSQLIWWPDNIVSLFSLNSVYGPSIIIKWCVSHLSLKYCSAIFKCHLPHVLNGFNVKSRLILVICAWGSLNLKSLWLGWGTYWRTSSIGPLFKPQKRLVLALGRGF